MPRYYAKKLAVIRNTSAPMIDSREGLEKASLNREFGIVKCITWNVKLNKGNEEVSALINSIGEANLIIQAYTTQLFLKILDILWSLITINKQQMSINGIIIGGFEISDNSA